MKSFDDVLFFYLYGSLNQQVISIYKDKFKILKDQFFMNYTNKYESRSEDWFDISKNEDQVNFDEVENKKMD